jgi:hypothetical protein
LGDIVPGIREASERAIATATQLHDDYVQTGRLWQEVLQRGRYGLPPLRVLNSKTGNMIAGSKQWAEAARLSQLRIRIRTFKDLAIQVELFIAALLKLWLTRFPAIVEEKSITLAAILESGDLAELKQQAISQAVDAAILGRMMGKPSKWFSYLKQHLGSTLSEGDAAVFIEQKASSDVLEHHEGVVDASYLEKSGAAAKYAVGDLIEPDDEAIDRLYDLA